MVGCLIVWPCGNASGHWPAGYKSNRPAIEEVRCRAGLSAPDVMLTPPFMAIVDIIIIVKHCT
jgi:hypothetical protein